MYIYTNIYINEYTLYCTAHLNTPNNTVNQLYFFWGFFFCLFRAAPGSSQARGRIRAVAAGLRHSHSRARSELCL